MDSFSGRLKELRQKHGLSQRELAERIGVSKSSINMYERGEREPGFAVLGEDNTMIATYIRGAGWNFEVVDTSLPLAIGIPTPRVDDTATPAREYVSLDLLNIGKSDQTSNKSVYVAYYSKENDKLVDLAMVRRSSTEAISSERLEFELDTEYSAEDVYVRAFTWEDSSMTNLAGFTEYYEIEEN